jgi:hypothetical protein
MSFELLRFNFEQWLIRRIAARLPSVTTEPERRAIVRAHILARDLAHQVAGKRLGKPTTYGEFFQLSFGGNVMHAEQITDSAAIEAVRSGEIEGTIYGDGECWTLEQSLAAWRAKHQQATA